MRWEAELYLTAQQCAELVDKFAGLISTYLKLGALLGKLRTQINRKGPVNTPSELHH
jgi:hypothetical protein